MTIKRSWFFYVYVGFCKFFKLVYMTYVLFVIWFTSKNLSFLDSGIDVVPPTVNCTDVHGTAASGNAGTTVDWTASSIRATDNSGVVTLIRRTHTPGDFFLVGATQVTYTFQDPSGNTATCSFNVIVTSDSGLIVCSFVRSFVRLFVCLFVCFCLFVCLFNEYLVRLASMNIACRY